MGVCPSSFDIVGLDAGRGHLVGQWEREMERILKDDWWVGFGSPRGAEKTKV